VRRRREQAAGAGRDRVLAIRRARNLTAFADRMVQIHLEARNVFAAREDARPPGFGAMGYCFHVDADEPEDRSRRSL
jgi:hypothetical protein